MMNLDKDRVLDRPGNASASRRNGCSGKDDRYPLSGLRIFLVDDELLIHLLLEDVLEDLGGDVVGNAFRPDEAIEALQTLDIDLAILDIYLAGELSYTIAEELDRRGIPYLFVTGYQGSAVDQRFRDRPRIGKPFTRDALLNVVLQTVG